MSLKIYFLSFLGMKSREHSSGSSEVKCDGVTMFRTMDYELKWLCYAYSPFDLPLLGRQKARVDLWNRRSTDPSAIMWRSWLVVNSHFGQFKGRMLVSIIFAWLYIFRKHCFSSSQYGCVVSLFLGIIWIWSHMSDVFRKEQNSLMSWKSKEISIFGKQGVPGHGLCC